MAADSDKPSDATMMDRLTDLACLAVPPMTPAQRQGGLAKLSARLAARQRRRSPMFGWGLLGLGTGAAACALWLLLAHGGAVLPSAIGYRAESGEILAGGYLRSFKDQGMTLRFSEGTKVELLPGARGRLVSVDGKGARMAIEEGPAWIQVTHRPGAHWLVDAGPFLITVKGTVFVVSWDAHSEELDLRLQKGLVSVTGPLIENAISVRGGQRLVVNLPKKEVVLQELDGEPERPVATMASPTLAPLPEGVAANSDPAPARAGQRSATRARARAPFGWAASLAAGEVDSILGDVERVGVKRSLVEASSEDLSALADAARYRRREDLARMALLAQRSRFADSRRARDAAFLLGRLEEAHDVGRAKALEWYDLYLEDGPTGAYASEALGRKMITTQKLTGNAKARAVALDYLRRFPSGTYAGAARALLQTP